MGKDARKSLVVSSTLRCSAFILRIGSDIFIVSFLFALVHIGRTETSQQLSVRVFFGAHSSMESCVWASAAR